MPSLELISDVELMPSHGTFNAGIFAASDLYIRKILVLIKFIRIAMSYFELEAACWSALRSSPPLLLHGLSKDWTMRVAY
ncbi:hypothetical protein [Chromatocurvus halotolerans]|uniref:Uncharacterized protein n=1 Tax=Chromatocurvus halotolerans TaxID=1132028 RepID=A0A4R2KNT7_9GAMM|nr:hypothetical protein [Chromatocurvus halotolerans]TCO75164.1 hypothetical protein EV688_110119 [Chromatocurvus halotolerans]